MPRVLVVDDDPEVQSTMASLLSRQDIPHHLAKDLVSTKQALQEDCFDLVLLDVGLPDGNGLDLLPEIKALKNAPEVIILTGRGDSEGAELAIEGGVWDYLLKPSPIKEIKLSISRALKYRQQKESARPRALDLSGVVGSSPAMQSCYDLLACAAGSDSNILITGETGVGKELMARTIHANSSRSGHPFVVVDCAGITDSLVESTLFGHCRGAFTGALADHTGLISQAHQGTLFLDELGELPLLIQKSLLRVLQERKFRPVGSSREQKSDFRLMAATNRDLEGMVSEGTFRNDLYFRIKTMHMHLPPLRDRVQDIRPLAMHFADELCTRSGIASKGLGADFLETLEAYSWPGNVRELCNVIEQALVACAGETNLYSMHLPKEIRIKVTRSRLEKCPPDESSHGTPPWAQKGDSPPMPDISDFKSYKQECEKKYLQCLLQKYPGNVPAILRLSGLSRSHFYTLLKKYGLES
ncbi:putative two component, sigma54 specific, transcriptional regulator, Fis family [Desulfonatronospira thiodismutans ASO3-1]|uniref:Two component, sigma54 specific, transcriptional regulator, Fis family n=1 Tax=Desulfonatronospira thiodismutans ASO3-1 TaxID=555779 RepID=D6SLE2_9BACT|nr:MULTISPECIES: sigma-54 dependent transcriptional regulator [Desulfonatronospira]EFI35503.1 putative two component, sigma54 specific, transcriptional regulator, Fis family [Desulfonatronospira thiodismutans ASO3-1]RQD77623.1 MAG: sigma-54-dependent Fis family transcriptional regulator [Desulfonatronospira sp. MSAO_Bac3]